eukprot:4798372-Amphidinium_carterae.1
MGGPALQYVHAKPLKNVTSRHKWHGVPFLIVAWLSKASCSTGCLRVVDDRRLGRIHLKCPCWDGIILRQ